MPLFIIWDWGYHRFWGEYFDHFLGVYYYHLWGVYYSFWVQHPYWGQGFTGGKGASLYQYCNFLKLFKTPLPPPPLCFEHLVGNFLNIGSGVNVLYIRSHVLKSALGLKKSTLGVLSLTMNNVKKKLKYRYSEASLRLSLYRGKLIGSRIINFWDMILTFRGAII